ncbi:hypothetical protein D9V32_13360 [Mycetocola tolaasinivorans]|uniref:Peptidylprolyl isomerase n=1 Tax=Mycetocola tolaasinivorans TaxID=76635 RepID=A0A3L7A443_9MICO|nr:hypothetical protein [Mycetocola tolaasinivorans]RLP74331.1 hypothetical protein D9V32_13360 [Mycetocola tolaasinivorans]
MRNTPALIVAAALLATGLTACSTTGPSAADCVPALPDGKAAALVQTSGKAGSVAKVEIAAPLYVGKSERHVAREGSGVPITGNQVVTMNFSLYNGQNGELLQSSEQTGAQPYLVDTLPEQFRPALTCAQAGSRIVSVIGTDDAKENTPGVVFVADITDVLPDRATGRDLPVIQPGLPSVVSAPDGTPGLTIPKSAAPTDLKVATLIKGEGKKLEDPNEAFAMHSTAASWKDRTIIHSSWTDKTPTVAQLGKLGPGLAEALKGQTIGSRVLVVVPPSKQDAAEQGNGSAIVYVVDILGTVGI